MEFEVKVGDVSGFVDTAGATLVYDDYDDEYQQLEQAKEYGRKWKRQHADPERAYYVVYNELGDEVWSSDMDPDEIQQSLFDRFH